MNRRDTVETMLEQAFRLAHFILEDREAARRAAVAAVAKLEVAASAQAKRLYYTPTGRPDAEAATLKRSKVSVGEAHLLQRLVLVETEPHERERERGLGAPLDEDAMTVHFIKHLVRITSRRNSFYVALGFSRLLHAYTTPEAMEFFGAVVQDPGRVPDDYYYRSRKKVLLRELADRFGGLVRVVKGQRGEERFERAPGGDAVDRVVDACLARFSPWGTPCPVPDPAAVRDGVAALAFEGADPDEEHPVEVRRIHAVTHPDCHRRLAAGLGLPDPKDRRDVPKFYLVMSSGSSGGGRREAGALSDAERREALDELGRRSAARRGAAPGLLSVRVDGAERARLDPARGRAAEFAIDGDAELIEVVALTLAGDELLLVHLLDWSGLEAGPLALSVTLEGGQRLSLDVAPELGRYGELERAAVAVAYAETAAARAVALAARRLLARIGGDGAGDRAAPWLRPATALVLLAAAGAGMYVVVRSRQPQDVPVASAPPAPPAEHVGPVPAEPDAAVPPPAVGEPEPSGPRVATSRPPGAPPGPRPRLAPGPDLTRSAQAWTAARLATTRAIYVDPLGEGGEPVRAAIGSALGGRFAASPSRDDADAVLKGKAFAAGGGRVRVTLRLVNADGETVWPAGRKAWSFTGTPEAAGAAAVRALEAAAGR